MYRTLQLAVQRLMKLEVESADIEDEPARGPGAVRSPLDRLRERE